MRIDVISTDEAARVADELKGQYKLIWLIGCTTGLRISDILALRVGQLLGDRTTVREIKTGKRRRIYVRKRIRREVEQYKEMCSLDAGELLFDVSRQSVWKAFKKAAARAGLRRNVGSHSMRKCYASAYIQKGYGVYDLQKRLNHTKLSDTIGYITPNSALGLDEKGRPARRRKRVS